MWVLMKLGVISVLWYLKILMLLILLSRVLVLLR